MSTASVWFIDGRLLYKSAKDDAQYLQFKKLRHLVEIEFRMPVRTALYFDSAPQNDADRKRHNYLSREAGFRVRTYDLGKKKIICPNCQYEIETKPQKCVDIAIAVSIIEYAMKKEPTGYNPIILSTGDRDFLPVLEKVRDKYDKDVVLVAPKRATAAELIAVTTRQIWLEEYYSSIAEPWMPRVQVEPASVLEECREDEAEHPIPKADAMDEATKIMKDVWSDLQRHEREFQGGRSGRPWGYMLNNFGKACERMGKADLLQPFLIEKDDGWKGANSICLKLAQEIWPGAEIMKDENGHPYLVLP